MTQPEFFSNIEPAIPSIDQWHKRFDVVIIGLGAAGLAAAIEAREAGKSVAIFDRFAGGGASKASGGVVYAGGGTAVQKAAGIEDDVDNMFAYLRQEVGDLINDAHLRDFCERSAPTIDWLIARNVRFGETVYPKKTSYPAPHYYLYHSDNSLLPAYTKHARPAARGHRGWVPIEQGKKAINLGGSIIDPLRAHAEKIGVTIFAFAPVMQLIGDPSKALGVAVDIFDNDADQTRYAALRSEAERLMSLWPPILPGGKFFYRRAKKRLAEAAQLEAKRHRHYVQAQGGVIICAGGFSFNAQMMAHYAPHYQGGYPLGTEGDNGAGIELGLSLGAELANMQRASAWRFINPPVSFGRGMIVNLSGQRFINEMVYGAHLGSMIAEHHGGKAWLILNKALVKSALADVSHGKALSFQRDLARLNVWFGATKARSMSELANKIGIDAGGAEMTWRHYCAAFEAGRADPFEKAAEDMADLRSGPFYAINVGLAAKLFPCPVMTLGGLKLDQMTGQVIGAKGAISGLYAAGRSAVGLCAENYISGLSIADGLYSGRRAARHIADTSA